MTYLLSFDDGNVIEDIYVMVNRPISFKTFMDLYVLDKVVLSRDSRDNLMTKDLIGVYKLDNDTPWDYEITMNGKLVQYPGDTDL